jgi:hypothetical protein
MMTHSDFFAAVASLRPGALFSVRSDDANVPHLEWDAANTTTAPSDKQIADEALRIAAGNLATGKGQADAAAYMATIRATRERVLNRLAGIGFAASNAATPDAATVQAVCKARAALLALPADPGVKAATTLADLRAAVTLAYKAIAVAAPASVKSAFDAIDT